MSYKRMLTIPANIAMLITAAKRLLPTQGRAAIGRSIRNFRRKPEARWGTDFIKEVRGRLPSFKVETIFDVGANIGLMALEFSDAFPAATVHAFEPGTENMRRLHANLSGKPNILRYQTAFGAEPGSVDLLIEPEHPSMARIGAGAGPTEPVTMDTIDRFCLAHQIPLIDLLKIDTEGYEIQVLTGAKGMLANNAISVIKAECAVDPDLSYHTQFSDLCDLLHPCGYRLFGFYDQWEDTLNPGPRIRRFDAAFISRPLYSNGSP